MQKLNMILPVMKYNNNNYKYNHLKLRINVFSSPKFEFFISTEGTVFLRFPRPYK